MSQLFASTRSDAWVEAKLAELSAGSAIGSVSQSIVNGTLATNDAPGHHGVVAVWAWAIRADDGTPINEFRQLCTGTLITNDLVLSAYHCFTEPNIDYGLTLIMLGNGQLGSFQTQRVSAGEGAPGTNDAAILRVNQPFVINGSTTGYRRRAAQAAAGQSVIALGYGNSIPGQRSPPSSICNTGTQGCGADPRPIRTSSHVTQWDAGHTGEELFVTPNAKNQWPTFGDSGDTLFWLDGLRQFLDYPIIGVGHSAFVDQNGVWHATYAPVQNFWGWLCGYAAC